MAKKGTTEAEFVECWQRLGSPSLVARELKISERKVYDRRKDLEEKGYKLPTFNNQSTRTKVTVKNHEGRIDLEINNGVVIVFSDAHYFPGIVSTAHKGLLWAIRELKPEAIICNGDAFDGSSISRHPRIGWDNKPNVLDELKAVTERLEEIRQASRTSNLFWPLGNHDSRFETYLAASAPQFQGVNGFALKDHFPEWRPCWSVWLNDDVVIKHRWKGGIHATHNNTVGAGMSIVTGHLHQLKVTPFSDYKGRRYGVDTGTLADLYGPQFIDYTEGNPVNWHSGFAVLTFRDGHLLQPELAEKWDEDQIQFRGEIISV